MDFLDPKAKRRRTIQLYVGYGLMATLISIITLILVFLAYGFDVDRKTGEVIQNGLVFVDSAPNKATVLLNNQEQKNKTTARFSLPAGSYDLRVRKDGYHEWHRDFTLNGGTVERFAYPLLIPTVLNRNEIQTSDVAPTFVSESPDRRWIVTNQANSITNFREYDLETVVNNKPASQPLVVPEDVFTATLGAQAIELVEWSSDNKHLLIKHTFDGRSEFVVVTRDQPTASININALLGVNPTTVTLKDKKFDQWFLYTKEGGILQSADAKKNVSPPLASGVTNYKTHGNDVILYSIAANEGNNQRVILKQGDSAFTIKDVPNGLLYLDIARYDGSWYTVIGSDADKKTYIYRDPMNVLQKRDGTKLTPRSILKFAGPINWLAFSQNTRFIVTQSSNQRFDVYDVEANRNYKYQISTALDMAVPAVWLDGHRIVVRTNGKALMFDFDGSNQQELGGSLPHSPLLINQKYNVLYTFDGSTSIKGKVGLYDTQLRLAGDK